MADRINEVGGPTRSEFATMRRDYYQESRNFCQSSIPDVCNRQHAYLSYLQLVEDPVGEILKVSGTYKIKSAVLRG
jgi:hypothetical protein